MDIRVVQEQARVPVTIFFLDGSIHLGNAEQIEQAIRKAVASGTRNIIIDLTNVPSITSAGLRVLHITYKLLGTETDQQSESPGKSPHLKLVNPSPSLRRVISIAGFDTFLPIYENVPEALASF